MPLDFCLGARYSFYHIFSFVTGRGVSFQIAVLNVLAGHPEGRASVADVKQYMAVLMCSGSDWSSG